MGRSGAVLCRPDCTVGEGPTFDAKSLTMESDGDGTAADLQHPLYSTCYHWAVIAKSVALRQNDRYLYRAEPGEPMVIALAEPHVEAGRGDRLELDTAFRGHKIITG